jgi:hypothetical protein
MGTNRSKLWYNEKQRKILVLSFNDEDNLNCNKINNNN